MQATSSRKFLLIFAAFWSLITSIFLVVLVYGCVNQVRSLSFQTTTGIVDTVKVTEDTTDDSTTYGIAISYHYVVDGKPYTSTRLRYAASSSSDSWARKTAKRFPAGARVLVYYNPARPGDAVLIRGIESSDLFLALFLTPFTVIMFFLWIAVANSFRRGRGLLGIAIKDRGDRTCIRLSRPLALMAPVGVLAISAFLSMFAVAFLFGGFHPAMHVVVTAWIIILILTAASAVAAQILIGTRRFCTILDDGRQMLLGRNAQQIAYSAMTGIAVENRPITLRSTQSQIAVFLDYMKDSRPARLKLMKWTDNPEDAQRFAAWLGVRLNLPVESADSSGPAQKTDKVTSRP